MTQNVREEIGACEPKKLFEKVFSVGLGQESSSGSAVVVVLFGRFLLLHTNLYHY
jgi:hypothetical protein